MWWVWPTPASVPPLLPACISHKASTAHESCTYIMVTAPSQDNILEGPAHGTTAVNYSHN